MHFMKTVTAKVFQSGNSQAIRLPKSFRFETATVSLTRTPRGILITDDADLKRRSNALARLGGSCPDFPETTANPHEDSPRDFPL